MFPFPFGQTITNNNLGTNRPDGSIVNDNFAQPGQTITNNNLFPFPGGMNAVNNNQQLFPGQTITNNNFNGSVNNNH